MFWIGNESAMKKGEVFIIIPDWYTTAMDIAVNSEE